MWNFAPNLVHVKPYHFFKHTGDINAPPGFTKRENDVKEGVDFRNLPNTADFKKLPKIPKKADTKMEEKPEESSSEDEPQKKEPRRESIDMPSFDSNSRECADKKAGEIGDADGEKKDKAREKKDDEGEKKVEECEKKDDESEKKDDDNNVPDVEDASNNETETKEEEKMVVDDLEISDSDSSSGKISKNVSDAEDTSEKKEKDDLEDQDDYLLYLEDILRTVHKAYYDLHDQATSCPPQEQQQKQSPDLKLVIPYVRRKTLQGDTLVMSGVVPTQVGKADAKALFSLNIQSFHLPLLGPPGAPGEVEAVPAGQGPGSHRAQRGDWPDHSPGGCEAGHCQGRLFYYHSYKGFSYIQPTRFSATMNKV